MNVPRIGLEVVGRYVGLEVTSGGVKRLIEYRGFSEQDARARVAAQAGEEQRREVADVWLDNSGTAGELTQRARELWHRRILPFAHNVQARRPAGANHGWCPSIRPGPSRRGGSLPG